MSDEKKTISNINIGEMLTAARDGKGLTIPTAALHCNLEASIIEKLEANKFSEIGAPVFTRGYLNLYARCLGLNEHEISEAFNQLKTNPNPVLQISEANAAAAQRKSFRRRGISKWLYLVPLLLALSWILQQLLSSDSWLMTQLNKALVSSQQEDNKEKGIVLTVGSEQTQNKTEVSLLSDNTPTQNTVSVVENTAPTNTDTSTDVTTTDVVEISSENDSGSEITLTSLTTSPEITITEEKPIEAEPVVSTNDSEAIKLSFTGGESWIQINDVNKKIVKTGGIKKGEVITLPASGAPYSFNIGRPENVEMTIYGKAEKLSKYQNSGSTRRFKVSLPNG